MPLGHRTSKAFRRQTAGRCRLSLEPLEARLLLARGIFITEFMAVNDDTLEDEDGDFADWIEIYNATLDAVDLGGWHLTDDPVSLDKWAFPAGVELASGEFLLVFASEKDRAVAGSELHTNFALDGNGSTQDGSRALDDGQPQPNAGDRTDVCAALEDVKDRCAIVGGDANTLILDAQRDGLCAARHVKGDRAVRR